ncbi:MAG TPA: glycoside hydrolase family 2 protein [Polyangiaceae bacterium]
MVAWLLSCNGHPPASPPAVGPPQTAPFAPPSARSGLPSPLGTSRFELRDGWTLESSAKAHGGGRELSTAGYTPAGGYPVTVPTTVLAGLVANHVYPDPYARNDLTRAPASAFDVAWWYRTEFTLPPEAAPGAVWLDLDGVNYKANVWLNGQLIASADQVLGTFTAYEFDVTAQARAGEKNALAIEVFPPDLKTDLALSWLDWNPGPPDRDMGLWHGVSIETSGPVAVRRTHVVPRLDDSLETAHLTIAADVVNTTSSPIRAAVSASVGGIDVNQEVELGARETKMVVFEPAKYPSLNLDRPKLWWPAQMGAQNLYDLRVTAAVNGTPSDAEAIRFGVRKVTFDLTKDGYRLFRVNGKPFFVRGGGWASDMMLRPLTHERMEAELAYVRDLGLNTIRLEGKLESDALYDRADELGIVMLPGWMCCDRWQDWALWTPDDHRIAVRSMVTQAERLRRHPSVFDFLIGSDEAPTAEAQKELREALARSDWPNPVSQSASDDGVKMTGPYDWVPPSYWYEDKGKYGGAWGFNTETGPGPAIPELESLVPMLTPEDLTSLWTAPAAPQFHAGTKGTEFNDLRLFNTALAARYGHPASLEDYVKKAQLMNYEAERAEFEAYSRNRYATATGVVHWMLNNAWPSLIWHLYGYDLAPAAGYFGAKKANEALHVQYSYDDRSVVVVNEAQEPKKGLTARVRVAELDGTTRFDQTRLLDIGGDASAKVLAVPPPPPAASAPPYLVHLVLSEGDRIVSTNVYWLSRRRETLDFARTHGHDTPTTQYADYRALATLAPTTLEANAVSEARGPESTTRVTLANTSSKVAFFVRLKLARRAAPESEQVLPVLWSDNYVSLLPGEKREIVARYKTDALRGSPASVEVRGWNVGRTILE